MGHLACSRNGGGGVCSWLGLESGGEGRRAFVMVTL